MRRRSAPSSEPSFLTRRSQRPSPSAAGRPSARHYILRYLLTIALSLYRRKSTDHPAFCQRTRCPQWLSNLLQPCPSTRAVSIPYLDSSSAQQLPPRSTISGRSPHRALTLRQTRFTRLSTVPAPSLPQIAKRQIMTASLIPTATAMPIPHRSIVPIATRLKRLYGVAMLMAS